jgi:hypothetical protein
MSGPVAAGSSMSQPDPPMRGFNRSVGQWLRDERDDFRRGFRGDGPRKPGTAPAATEAPPLPSGEQILRMMVDTRKADRERRRVGASKSRAATTPRWFEALEALEAPLDALHLLPFVLRPSRGA